MRNTVVGARPVMERDAGLGMKRMVEFVVLPLVPVAVMLVLIMMRRKT